MRTRLRDRAYHPADFEPDHPACYKAHCRTREREHMDVIARRSFQLLDQQITEILLSIERPVADGPDFKCRYEINWPGNTRRGHAMGVDEVQALQLALRNAGADISHSTYAKDKKLVWLEPGKGFGLPY